MSSPYLTDQLGGPALAVTLGGQLLDLAAVGPVVMRHGRDDPSQPLDAASCQLTVRTDALTKLPTIGSALLVELGAGAIAYTGLQLTELDEARVRFTGHVTDVAATPATPGTPATVRVTAVSRRARLGRTYIGDVPWPQELDGARASRILQLVATATGATIGTVDEGTVQVLARDVDRQPALDLLDQLAVTAGGQLVELRNGTLTWHDAAHRGRAAADVELTASQVLSSVESTQQLSGIVNELRVVYGTAPTLADGSQGDRPAVTYTDPTSWDTYGPFSADVATQLAEQAAAEQLARLTVGRRSLPAWELRQLVVDVTRTVPSTTAARLLRLQHASLVSLVGFPSSGPFSTARVWVEGWTETVTRHGWQLQLSVSDYGRGAPEPRWVDLNPDTTWAQSDVTWLQAVGWDSGPGRQGRWVDVPADARWGTYDPTPTWATS